MTAPLSRLQRALSAIDIKTAISAIMSLGLFVFICSLFFYGQQWLALEEGQAVQDFLTKISSSPIAIIFVIAMFVVLALSGFPQFLLISATVLVFGSLQGAIYSWLATMVSASVTFVLGQVLGGVWVERFGGARTQSLVRFLSRRGILASGLVRLVPTGPFVLVNAAAGAAKMVLWKYWLGTGIGIIPKILLVAMIGSLAPDGTYLEEGDGGILAFIKSREPLDLILMGVLLPIWLGFLLIMRKVYFALRG